MTILQSKLRSAAGRRSGYTQSRALNQRTGFLCHSHKDRDLALGMQQLLKEQGLDLYIDWQDNEMPDQPDRRTAERIQAVIKTADVFLFLATGNAMSSRWCPWELGYADGVARYEHIAIIPTLDSNGRYHGNEYLHLYRRIDDMGAGLGWYKANTSIGQGLHSFF